MPNTLKGVPHMSELYSTLGYRKGESLKQYMDLDDQISASFNKYVAGRCVAPPIPHKWVSEREDMANLADKFLHEGGRGETFWPEQRLTSASTLHWPRDKEEIKDNLTSIFRRKANNAYNGAFPSQKSGKKTAKAIPRKSSNQKKRKTIIIESDDDSDCQSSLISERTESEDDSDCQPESSRRPPPGTACLDPGFGIKPHLERPKDSAGISCIRYVKSLSPHHDAKHLIVFTKKWLTENDTPWPEPADLRLQFYMHNRKLYTLGVDQKERINEDIIGILARGTELADLEDGMLISKFLDRIQTRIIDLTKNLIAQLFLNRESGGTVVQTKTFSRVWSGRREHFQVGLRDASSEEFSDASESDYDPGYKPRKRPQTWKQRENNAGSDISLPAPKRRRRPVQRLRAKQPITPEFPNLRTKPDVRSSSELAAMATTALGITRPSTSEQAGEDVVVPTADNMNHPQWSRPRSLQIVTPPQLPSMREASVEEIIEVDTSTSSPLSVFDHTSDSETSERDSTPGSNHVGRVRDKSPVLTIPEVSSGRQSLAPTMKESSSASTVASYPRSFYSSTGSQAKYSPYPTSAETSVIRSTAREPTTQILTLQIQRADGEIDLSAPYRWEENVANSSLDEFCEFFAEVSKTKPSTLSELTFQFQFGGLQTFPPIPRYGGRIYWERMKNNVAAVFSGWKGKNPGVMESCIMVKGDGVFDYGQE